MNNSQATLTCTMCGHTFDPSDHAACQGCPLHDGCALVRCPNCGFETANPEQSYLAQLFRKLFMRQAPTTHEEAATTPGWQLTLADVPAGQQAEIGTFLAGLPDERQAHLRAYGLTPGSRVLVKQHRPVTVIQVDHTELALESTLARQIGVRQTSAPLAR